jgi:DNA-binding NarL/FixJ family response regulator
MVFCIGNCLERKAAGLVRLGADSFLDLRRGADETGRAVRRILCGKDYVPSNIAKIAGELERYPDDERPLTRQQVKIFKLTLFCMKSQAMSKLLRLSDHTIKMHRRNISLKCGGGRYIDWFFYGLRHNLITLEEIREHWQEERGCNEVLD